MEFNPANWYWVVAGDTSRAYSSAAGDYVKSTDPAFRAWCDSGGKPTAIATEAELGDVLAANYLTAARPTVAGILDGFQQAQADELARQKLFKFLFTLNNRVRALEGQQALTVAQARSYFKGLM